MVAHKEQQQTEKRPQRDSHSSGEAEGCRPARRKGRPSALTPPLAASLALFKVRQQKTKKDPINQESNSKIAFVLSYLALWQLRPDSPVPSDVPSQGEARVGGSRPSAGPRGAEGQARAGRGSCLCPGGCETPGQAAQRGSGCLGNVQGRVGWGLQQPDPGKDVPAHGEGCTG